MSKFNFAILGAGNIAGQFCDAVSHVKEAQVTAVASKNRDKAKAFSERFNVLHYYGSTLEPFSPCR